jgi:hypothetical protein
MNLRDQLRAKTVGAPKNFRRVFVSLDDYERHDEPPEGVPCVEVRAPTMRAQTKILGMLRAKQAKNGEIEIVGEQSQQMVTAIVECCFVPLTDEKLFEVTDIPSMLESPLDGYLAALGTVSLELMNGAGAAAKKSETTPPEKSS